MQHRFIAGAVAAVLLFQTVGLAAGDTRRAKLNARAARLVAMLPASDGAAVFDAKRFLDTALPTVLSANQPLLANITAKITEIETRTGIDLGSFEQVAVGLTVRSAEANNLDVEAVAIASGDVNVTAVIDAARAAGNGTHAEETVGGKTVLIFTPKLRMSPSANGSTLGPIVDRLAGNLEKGVAVAAIDGSTLVVGSPARVRDAIGGRSHLAPDLSSLLAAKGTSVASFAVRNSGLLATLLPYESDELGKKIALIRTLSGSVDVANGALSSTMIAKTATTKDALGLKDLIEVLRDMGVMTWSGSKNADKQLYGRVLKTLKVESRLNSITLGLTIPQADLDRLVAKLK